ncbi:MAG: polynucleotide adenylyltransferase PcnB [Pseudomonadota bacterium]|nr:polynucleotide adenylyltransferase PcnB [Pseudomonadota bacterium]
MGFITNILNSIKAQVQPKLRPTHITPDKAKIGQHSIHPAAKKIIFELQKAGYEAYIVGGALRDLLTATKPKDFDIVTNATPNQIKKLFRSAIIIGRRFKIVHVRDKHNTFEVATFRSNRSGKVDKHGFRTRDNEFGTISDDVKRRDFTINALYYDPKLNELLDFTKSCADIDQKRIRMIGKPEERFKEDPVRMLRAARMAAKLKFDIDEEILESISNQKHLLANISSDRLSFEIQKLFYTGHARRSLEKLNALGLFNVLFPQTQACLSDKKSRKQTQIFLNQACYNADQRYLNNKTLSSAFLYAVLLWWPLKKATIKLRPRDRDYPKKFMAAAETVIHEQQKTLKLPKKIIEGILQIWQLQLSFMKSDDYIIDRVLKSPRFRAGLDLLTLRAHANETVWWQAVKWQSLAHKVEKPTTAK